jgi:hypothetical protein
MALLDKVPGESKLYIGGYVVALQSASDRPIFTVPSVTNGMKLMA